MNFGIAIKNNIKIHKKSHIKLHFYYLLNKNKLIII